MVKRPAGGRWSWKGHGRCCCSQMMGTHITRAGQETEVLGSWLCHVIVCRFHLVMKSQDDLPFLFFETGSHSPGWPGTQYITETFDLLPSTPKCWNFGHVLLPHLFPQCWGPSLLHSSQNLRQQRISRLLMASSNMTSLLGMQG